MRPMVVKTELPNKVEEKFQEENIFTFQDENQKYSSNPKRKFKLIPKFETKHKYLKSQRTSELKNRQPELRSQV